MIILVKGEGDEWCFFDDKLRDIDSIEELDYAIDLGHEGEFLIAVDAFKSLITKNPYHIDAYHHLSMLYERYSMPVEAYLCCREAARIGVDATPEEFSWKVSQLSWNELDNRPFMRAYHNLGLWLNNREETNEAITVFSNLLSVCPNDNLGVRHILPELWFSKGDLLAVIRHCKAHEEDYYPDTMYTYPLALILSGEVEKAKPLLSKAKSEFPLFAKELKKKRHPKPKSNIPDFVAFGGVDHVYEYWQTYGQYWASSPQAMKLL